MYPARPIGFWTKLLDDLLEATLDRTLADHGLSRRHWQVLNTVSSRARSSGAVGDELAPFLTSPGEAGALLDDLETLGWVRSAGDLYELTDDGRSRLERAEADVALTRRTAGRTISPEQYDVTLATLETMCRNLGWDDEP